MQEGTTGSLSPARPLPEGVASPQLSIRHKETIHVLLFMYSDKCPNSTSVWPSTYRAAATFHGESYISNPSDSTRCIIYSSRERISSELIFHFFKNCLLCMPFSKSLTSLPAHIRVYTWLIFTHHEIYIPSTAQASEIFSSPLKVQVMD